MLPLARSAMSPAGPAARILAALGWPVLAGFVVVSAVMWALLAWVALRRRGTFAEHAPVSAGEQPGMRWLLVGGFIVPGIAFVAIFVATLGVLDAFPMEHGRVGRAPIRVTGHQWWWQVDYLEGELAQHFVTANEIHIPTGRAVEIELVSADVIHSFWVPRLHGKVDLVPGSSNYIRIEADRPGVYEGECAEFCGLEHAEMRFRVVAQDPAAYASWLEQQRRPAATPATEPARRGQAVFMAGACPACHAVHGTSALATVGPDLTHLGSRSTLAAGWLSNDTASLHAWIVNAPSLKPGAQMPTLTMLTGPELHDLVAYLQSLQ